MALFMIQLPYLPYIFAMLIAMPFLMVIRRYCYGMLKLKQREVSFAIKGNSQHKIQAYERMTLFLERLKPANFVKKFSTDLQPHEFIFLTEKTIQEEFEYNAAQQLYLAKGTWEQTVFCKNEILKLLHKTHEEANKNISLTEYKTVLLMNYVNGEDYISQTINSLRSEILI